MCLYNSSQIALTGNSGGIKNYKLLEITVESLESKAPAASW